MERRSIILGFVAAILACANSVARAEWPERNITIVVPLAAGGSTDITARLLAEKIGLELGQKVLIENRPGAGGNVGTSAVARSAPDGYTLLVAASTIAANATLYKTLGFDPVKDLVPVSQLTRIPNVLMVNNDIPAKTLAEFISYVASRRSAVSYGSAGNGTSSHLSGALFNSLAKGEMVHVPYRGGAPANTDLLAGQIQAVFAPLVEVLPYIEARQLRALGVTTKDRSSKLPDLPAINEVMPGYEIALWNGVFAPVGTPSAVVDRLSAAIQKVMRDPGMRKVFDDQGTTAIGSSPQEFQPFFVSEIETWGKLVKLSGARVD